MTIPKAELHVHLEGTATPELVRRIAQRNGLDIPDGVFAAPDRFAWRDFLDFLNTYNLVCGVIRTGEDYRDIAYEYLAACARDGVIYVELTASIDHARLSGMSDAEHFAGIAAGIDDARRDHGIEARILSVAVRNYGVQRAIEIAEVSAARPHPYVVRAIEDPRLVRELAARRITLEVCPTSNVVLGVVPSFEEHPFPALREAGIPLTLGSDDPPYFGASVAGEYAIAREHFGLDDSGLLDVTRTAIEASFAEPALRDRLLAALTNGDVPSL